MSAQVQINNVNPGQGAITVTGFIALTGNYPTGGEVLNFATAIQDPSFIGLLAAIESSALLNIDVWSMGGTSVAASATEYNPVCTRTGTPAMINPASGVKLKVAALGGSTEHAASAYEASILGDLIAFQATFTKLL